MLSHRYYITRYLFLLIAGLTACREPYAPPAITQPNRYLVVDGFINTGANTVTAFKLNRTRNLGDTTVVGIPELNAQVSLVGSNGNTYPLIDSDRIGTYNSSPLTLDVTQLYQIVISTTAGEKFSSDPVPCLANPPIDSVFWRQPSDLSIYATTHDPTDNTHYYRYDYNETWEHDSQLQSVYTVVNGYMVATDSSNQTTRCWTTDTSTNILLATSAAAATDTITGFNLVTIPNSDPRVDIDYSIFVRQYALTADAYNYWLLIQKTTQDVGTLFDVQPTQLIGNIHCTTNPAEPVIGFISATNIQSQRIDIFESSLHDWTHNQPGFTCDTMSIPVSFANPFAYNFSDPYWAPYYFASDVQLVLTTAACLNCTLFGGTNIRPPFMPN
jgi:Domain of unknown function (DUF4249)